MDGLFIPRLLMTSRNRCLEAMSKSEENMLYRTREFRMHYHAVLMLVPYIVKVLLANQVCLTNDIVIVIFNMLILDRIKSPFRTPALSTGKLLLVL